jgi:hypothetical protein
MKNFSQVFISVCLVSLLLLSGCGTQYSSRFDQTQKDTKGKTAVVKESTSGGEFNRCFPKGSDGYKRVYTQEKKGFAEAKLEKDGKTYALIAVSDLKNNLSAADKFKSSTKEIGGYPSVNQGSTATALLVEERYQVKVLSKVPSFSKQDREAWLSKFDLGCLSNLQ